MNAQQVMNLAGCSKRAAHYFAGGRGFSKALAKTLEAKTGIHRLYWMFPQEYDQAGVRLPAQPQDAA